ncbi:MAG: metallophosphoesterase [Clostridium sp.]|nr:metallophosphoesterase [Clostridium sp.]
MADTHHYSKTLGTDGRQYELRSGSDQKCLAETDEIIDAAFEEIGNSDTNYVLIAGDVTNDGEMVSHLEFREKLYKLKEKKPVYLITATHDWCCDQNPRRYDGDKVYHDVPIMTSKELPEFYKDFGPNDAISIYTTFIGTCSYVVQLNEKVRLLALNDDKNENYHAGFTEAHFLWIEEQLKKAKDDGCLMIGMEHHLLTPHISPLITGGGTCVADREYVASRLADAGLRYMFVGHSHIQNTTSFKSVAGNTITEINVGSLVGYPAPMVNVTVNEDMTLSYEVKRLKEFKINNNTVDAQEYLKEHALALIHRIIEAPSRSEFCDRLTALQLNGEKFKKFYKIIKPLLERLRTGTVMDLYSKLKKLGLSGTMDENIVKKFADKKIMDFADQIMLSAFDGSVTKYKRTDDYYKLVMSVITIPSRLFKKNNDCKKLIFAIDAILTGGRFDNQKDII